MDNLLGKLGNAPLPSRLADIDDAVMFTFAARRNDARATSRLLPVAAILALGIGYAGGSVLPAPARAANSKMIFVETAFAPSTLLNFL